MKILEKKRKEVDLNDYRKNFLIAEFHYNSVGKNARNVKRIIETNVKESELELRLESDGDLVDNIKNQLMDWRDFNAI